MARMPGVSAVWRRHGNHFDRVTPVRWDRMPSQGERAWFKAHAQELLDTTAAKHGADVIATLVDDTTYSVAGRPRRHPAPGAGHPDRLRGRWSWLAGT